jgi:hypothetical protein
MSSRCGFHDYGYQWCYLEEGSWGYCSTDFDHIEKPFLKGEQLEEELDY